MAAIGYFNPTYGAIIFLLHLYVLPSHQGRLWLAQDRNTTINEPRDFLIIFGGRATEAYQVRVRTLLYQLMRYCAAAQFQDWNSLTLALQLNNTLLASVYLAEAPQLCRMHMLVSHHNRDSASSIVHTFVSSSRQGATQDCTGLAESNQEPYQYASFINCIPGQEFHLYDLERIQRSDMLTTLHEGMRLVDSDTVRVWASRLACHHYLPLWVHHVVAMDTDTLIVANLDMLFSHFQNFRPNQLIGAGIEFQPEGAHGKWDKLKRDPVWSASCASCGIGEFGDSPYFWNGINGGLILYHTKHARASTLYTFFLSSKSMLMALENAVWHSHQAHDLGDQDAINTLAITLPEVIYILPCAWNYQTAHYWHVMKFIETTKLTNETLRFHPCKSKPFLWHFNGFDLNVTLYQQGVINIVNRTGIFKEQISGDSVVNNEEDVRFEGHMAYNCSIRCGTSLSGLALTTGLLHSLPSVAPTPSNRSGLVRRLLSLWE